MQFFISAMAVLATVMLGTSQEDSILPMVALLSASISLVCTDWLRWFSLHPILAGILGLIAGIYAFIQSQSSSLAEQFVSVANLLIHLQLILLFQKKSIRIYWQLITLSLLQVVVAAALNLFVFFGPLLVVYTGCAICAMILFFIHRETFAFLEPTERKHKQNVIELEQQTRLQFTAKHAQPVRRLFRKTGFRSFAMLAISTVLMSLSVFLLMPRFGDGVWRPNNQKVAATGFDGDSVDLSDVGALYENPAIVMRVSFTTESIRGEELPYVINGVPYLRGTALEEYKYGRGRWSRHLDLRDRDFSQMPRPQRLTSAVRQTVSLEIPKKGVVFTLPPAVSLEDSTTSLRAVTRTNEVRYFPEADEDPASYSLGTTSLINGTQSQFSPRLRELSFIDESRRKREIERNMPELKALADEIVRDIPPENKVERARALERHFTNRNNDYKYSLDGPEERDPKLDPVVDFAINHKTGHCQYYASALALMLRSVDIPSRVIIGYRCDNYNVVGNYYQVREMDAHAWVEAAIDKDQLPDEIMPQEGIPSDAWIRLDPTPSENVTLAQVQLSPWRIKLNDSIDYMQLLWSEYVLGLNEKRQRRRIYQPIQDFFKTTTALAFSPDVWVARWGGFLSSISRRRFPPRKYSRLFDCRCGLDYEFPCSSLDLAISSQGDCANTK